MTHRLLALAEELRKSAADVIDMKNRKLSAAVMLKAAAELERPLPANAKVSGAGTASAGLPG